MAKSRFNIPETLLTEVPKKYNPKKHQPLKIADFQEPSQYFQHKMDQAQERLDFFVEKKRLADLKTESPEVYEKEQALVRAKELLRKAGMSQAKIDKMFE